MKLRRIRIEQFRRFRRPLEIVDLVDGINLFAGPNEAGKSTLVAAIRAAFFERHRSSSVDDLRPWGDASAAPTVELEFTIGDRPYRLAKTFLARKRCELQAGALRLDGAAAEDHLAELLGFQFAGKGASAAQHWGIPGLLWIEQGAGQSLREPVTHATDHLRTALNASLGEVASSGGDELLARVEALRNELLTPAGGDPRGDYREALKREAQLQESVRAIADDVQAYRQQVDRLDALRRAQADDAAGQPWAVHRAGEQQARQRLEAIERVQASLATDRRRAEELQAQCGLLRGQLDAFDVQDAALRGRADALEAARERATAAGQLVEPWAARAAAAQTAADAAREQLRQARANDARARRQAERDDVHEALRAARTRLAQAEAEQARRIELQAAQAAAPMSADTLRLLREQARQLRELQIRREAVATRLHFSLNDGAQVWLGDETLVGDGERLLLAPARLDLGAIGTLEIAPGGADLASLARDEQSLADRHAASLQQAGVDSLAEAETREQLQQQRAAELKAAAATLQALAPRGVDGLRADVAALEARAGEIAAALDLPFEAGEAASRITLSEAEAADDAARRALDAIGESLGQARLAAGHAQAVLEGAQREHAAALASRDAPDRAARLRAAQQALVDARAEEAALAERMRAKSDEIAQARPEILQQDVERLRRSAEQLERAFDDRRVALLLLEADLDAKGAQGLEERQAGLARELEQAARRSEELRRRAAALDHLLDRLKTHRGALTRRLQAPLQKHLDHYLQLLFPRAQVAIDDDLGPGVLTRAGPTGHPEASRFESLSFGAREQMGLIGRLAYADLLREAGRPTLVILDDALVHSDAERLAQMKRILFDAGTRHQILLMTCHPENWRDLGVAPRSIDELVQVPQKV